MNNITEEYPAATGTVALLTTLGYPFIYLLTFFSALHQYNLGASVLSTALVGASVFFAGYVILVAATLTLSLIVGVIEELLKTKQKTF